MTFYPISFHIEYETKAIFSYQFVQLMQDVNLFSCLVSAIEIMNREVFDEDLFNLSFNDYHIIIQPISNFNILLLYKGDREHAEQLIFDITTMMIEQDLIQYFDNAGRTSSVGEEISQKFTNILKNGIQVDLNEQYINISHNSIITI